MKTVLAILLAVLVLLQLRLWIGPGSVADIARLEQEIEAQSDENAQLDARNDVLMEEVSDLRNGLDSIEERARNELGLIRQGETFYLIVEGEPAARSTAAGGGDGARVPELTPGDVMPEPPPQTDADDNPYLELFRDEAEAPASAGAQEPDSGTTAGQ